MAVAFVVEHSLRGENIGYRQALRQSFSRWGSVIGTGILAGLIIFGLTLLLIVPGIIWGVYYLFIVYIVALRGQGGKKALDYSKSLVKGRWWRVFGVFFVVGLLTFVFILIVDLPFGFMPVNFLTDVLSGILADIVWSFFTIATVLFFLNLDYLKNTQD